MTKQLTMLNTKKLVVAVQSMLTVAGEILAISPDWNSTNVSIQSEHVYYQTSTKSVSFNVVDYLLGLVAKIEPENNDGTWRPHAQLGVDDLPYGQMAINDSQPVTGLRIKLCLQNDEQLCG